MFKEKDAIAKMVSLFMNTDEDIFNMPEVIKKLDENDNTFMHIIGLYNPAFLQKCKNEYYLHIKNKLGITPIVENPDKIDDTLLFQHVSSLNKLSTNLQMMNTIIPFSSPIQPDFVLQSLMQNLLNITVKIDERITELDSKVDLIYQNTIKKDTDTLSSKPVEQTCIYTGEIINTFDSIEEASEETGISQSSIDSSLNKRNKKAGGYFWRSKGSNLTYNKKQINTVEVEQIDLQTGKVIATFDSIKQASEKVNVRFASISNVVNDKQKTAGGFGWRRVGSC
jgi:hypothetical protein